MDGLSSVPSAGSLCIHIFRAESSLLLIHVIFVLNVLNPFFFLSFFLSSRCLCSADVNVQRSARLGGFMGGIFFNGNIRSPLESGWKRGGEE